MSEDKDMTILLGGGKSKEPKEPKIKPLSDGKVQMIEVIFPMRVKFPPGFDRALDSLVSMITAAYEQENPYRSMWISGMGSRPNMMAIHSDDHENMFNDEVYHLEVSEHEASPRDLERRGYTLCDTTCPECSLQQFQPKINELPEPGWVVCPNMHWHESGVGQGVPIQHVHILNGGLALCLFTSYAPQAWPENHKFVPFMDKDVLKAASCRDCERVYKRMKDSPK